LPAGATDANLPRLIIGFRITTELFADIGRRFLIENLSVGPEAAPAGDRIALDGLDGRPLAWVTWTAPTPGRAMLHATLWPLVGLMIAVGAIVILVSRELVRLARRLEVALGEARAADRTKSEFLSNVSHELRTPLNGVIGIAQLLQMRHLDPEARHMLDILLASAQSQLQLVNGLLDITRIEAGTMTLEREPFHPSAVLEDTVALIAPEIEKKRLALHFTVAPEARRPVLGDALAFRQIATNLIGNALKFTDSGGITVACTSKAGALVLTVSDTGIGIDPTQHDRIFGRFVQLDGAPTRRAGGAGLGLAITRAIVELERGSIRVESALGEGATFIVELPLPAVHAMVSAA
jgi:signal transduction histidine kinase